MSLAPILLPVDPVRPADGVRPRIALVGCGQVGELHRERLAQEAVDIVAICDPNAEALSRMAARIAPRPRLFRSEQDLLIAGIVDGVVLCTPHGLHAAQIAASLAAGVHVLCEKPFVTDAADAVRLVAQAKAANLALFVAYTRRSRGHARFLRYAATQIAPLTHIHILRAQPWQERYGRTWRMHTETGGGFLLDNGVSMLDLVLQLSGDSPVLSATTELSRALGAADDVDVDIRAFVSLHLTDGIRADLSLIGDATEEIEEIRLFGENGTAGWLLRDGDPAQLYLRRAGSESEMPDAGQYRVPLPDAAFVAAIRAGRPVSPGTGDLYDAATVVPVVELTERLYKTAVWR